MSSHSISTKTRKLLQKHGITLKKKWGQNFLTDPHILKKIISAAELDPQSGVIEIGPGIGALTEPLAESVKQVVTIEIDPRLVAFLQQQFVGHHHVQIVSGDVLSINMEEWIDRYMNNCSSIHLVANLPYYITTPIIVKMLESRYPFSNLVVMMQKEVADRLVATPGGKDYSSISVLVQYYTEPEQIVRVPRHVFVPRPQVDSAVVKLKVRSRPKVEVRNETLFFQVIRASFAKRRKTLRNALHAGFPQFSKAELEPFFQNAGIDGTRRGETLSIEEFAQLADQIHRGCEARSLHS